MRGSHSCKSSKTPFRTKCTSNAKPATSPRVRLFICQAVTLTIFEMIGQAARGARNSGYYSPS